MSASACDRRAFSPALAAAPAPPSAKGSETDAPVSSKTAETRPVEVYYVLLDDRRPVLSAVVT